jgi:hypothetical protein
MAVLLHRFARFSLLAVRVSVDCCGLSLCDHYHPLLVSVDCCGLSLCDNYHAQLMSVDCCGLSLCDHYHPLLMSVDCCGLSPSDHCHPTSKRQPSIFRATKYRSAVCPLGLCRRDGNRAQAPWSGTL